MNPKIVFVLFIAALGYGLMSLAQWSGLLAANVLSIRGVIGALVTVALLLFPVADRVRGPKTRIRRDTCGVSARWNPRPCVPAPDWSYTA
jgi:hypothetical protein